MWTDRNKGVETRNDADKSNLSFTDIDQLEASRYSCHLLYVSVGSFRFYLIVFMKFEFFQIYLDVHFFIPEIDPG